MNIVSNASKFTERGFIHADMRAASHKTQEMCTLVISVEDSGIGMHVNTKWRTRKTESHNGETNEKNEKNENEKTKKRKNEEAEKRNEKAKTNSTLGISPEVSQRIFEPFVQADSS